MKTTQEYAQMLSRLPNIGLGLGLRNIHFNHITEHWPAVDWFEIISENFMDTGGRPRHILRQVAERYPIAMHGVSLSIGSTYPIDFEYLGKLKKLAAEVNPAWISDHLPHFATVADEISFLKAVQTDQFNHGPAQLLMHTGSARLGRPSIGAWATYGLGSENANLPGFVVLTSGGRFPDAGKSVWGSGFL
eukprot:gene7896-10680_t